MSSETLRQIDGIRGPVAPISTASANSGAAASGTAVLPTAVEPVRPAAQPTVERASSGNLDPKLLEAITEEINSTFARARGLRFKISPDTHNLVVQVIDLESEEVIRSIPPERLIRFRDSFREISEGILLDDRA